MSDINYEKLYLCCLREAGIRKKVYPKWVEQGKMHHLKRTAGGTLPNAEILKRSGYDEQTAEELAQKATDENYDAIPNLG